MSIIEDLKKNRKGKNGMSKSYNEIITVHKTNIVYEFVV